MTGALTRGLRQAVEGLTLVIELGDALACRVHDGYSLLGRGDAVHILGDPLSRDGVAVLAHDLDQTVGQVGVDELRLGRLVALLAGLLKAGKHLDQDVHLIGGPDVLQLDGLGDDGLAGSGDGSHKAPLSVGLRAGCAGKLARSPLGGSLAPLTIT